jgi:SAM-dependent methyltransferase
MDPMNWENRYQQADTPWDKGAAHPMLSHWLGHVVIDGAIVVPGCGRGWDLRAWAEAYPQHSVIGIDIAPSAVSAAQELCRGLPNVRVVLGDFFDPATWQKDERVGLIWEHTCFCAIPPSWRERYVATAAAVLPASGLLLGVFFTDMDDEGAGPPWNTPVAELIERFSPFFEVEEIQARHRTYQGREGEERSFQLRRRQS